MTGGRPRRPCPVPGCRRWVNAEPAGVVYRACWQCVEDAKAGGDRDTYLPCACGGFRRPDFPACVRCMAPALF